jgi:hypothetical protein
MLKIFQHEGKQFADKWRKAAESAQRERRPAGPAGNRKDERLAPPIPLPPIRV